MDKIYFIARFLGIHEDNLGSFKKLAAEAIEDAKQVDETHLYEWFFSTDETECVVLEAYADSEAVLAHSARMKDLLPQMIGLCGSFEFECYGSPSPALRDAIAFPEGSLFTFYGGK